MRSRITYGAAAAFAAVMPIVLLQSALPAAASPAGVTVNPDVVYVDGF